MGAKLGPKRDGQGASAMKDEESKGWSLMLGESRDQSWGRTQRVDEGRGWTTSGGRQAEEPQALGDPT